MIALRVAFSVAVKLKEDARFGN